MLKVGHRLAKPRPDLGELRPIELLERAAPAELDSLVRATLDAVLDQPGEPLNITDAVWAQLWPVVLHHRVEGFVNQAVAAGPVVVSEVAADQLRQRGRRIAMSQLALRAAAEKLGKQLGANGIEVRIVKGLATSALDWNRSAARRTSDVDVLIKPDQFDHACRLILETGARELKPGLPAHLIVERTFRTDEGIALDIHHRLFRFGTDTGNGLFDRADQLPNSSLRALSPEGRLVHAAGHLLLSPPGHRQMSSLFDVAVLARTTDVSDALSLAERFGVADVLRVSIWLADAVGSSDPPKFPEFKSTRINRAHLRADRRVDLELFAVLADAASARDRALLLQHHLGQMRRARKRHVARKAAE